MIKEEIKNKVRNFIETEEHSCTPIQFTAENIARLCYITVENAVLALKELGR